LNTVSCKQVAELREQLAGEGGELALARETCNPTQPQSRLDSAQDFVISWEYKTLRELKWQSLKQVEELRGQLAGEERKLALARDEIAVILSV